MLLAKVRHEGEVFWVKQRGVGRRGRWLKDYSSQRVAAHHDTHPSEVMLSPHSSIEISRRTRLEMQYLCIHSLARLQLRWTRVKTRKKLSFDSRLSAPS